MSLIYNVEFSNEAKKFLKRQDQSTVVKIYRLRVGAIRILHEVINDRVIIFVFKIGPSGDVYK